VFRRVFIMLCLMAAVVGCQRTPPEYVSRYTPSSTTVAPAPAAAVAFIGDSYTAGTEFGGQGPAGWPMLVTEGLRQQGINLAPSVAAEAGSGYVLAGEGEAKDFSELVADAVRPDDRLVVIFGGQSDADVPADQLQPAVRQTLEAVRETTPKAEIVVIGPAWPNSAPPPEVLQTRDLIRDEAVMSRVIFVDPIAEGWFVDRPDLIASDGIHPTDAGHAYMADKIAPLIAQQLQLHNLR
jgi:lysophospholipase L1-like esterase